MKPDLYTKTVLTLIALLLAVCAVRLPAATVRADSPEVDLQFDPDVHQIDVPGGSASLSGRIAIDTRTGYVYGFPQMASPTRETYRTTNWRSPAPFSWADSISVTCAAIDSVHSFGSGPVV